jgi:hypothetical protein
MAQEAEGAQTVQRWVKDTGKTDEAEEPQQACRAGNAVKEPEQLRSGHEIPSWIAAEQRGAEPRCPGRPIRCIQV